MSENGIVPVLGKEVKMTGKPLFTPHGYKKGRYYKGLVNNRKRRSEKSV